MTDAVTTARRDPPESLTSRAYDRLRADIIEGALKPGIKLKIEHLREHYGFGASPVREALSLLTSDGLVDRIDQRGFRVASVSEVEFDDLLKARCWLEAQALREAVAHGDTAWEERIVLAAYRLSRIPRSIGAGGEFVANAEWEGRHKEFHMALIAACDSPILMRYCDQLYDQNIRYRNLAGPAAYPGRDPEKEHEAIMQAALSRDADAAAKHLISHYRQTGAFLRKQLGK